MTYSEPRTDYRETYFGDKDKCVESSINVWSNFKPSNQLCNTPEDLQCLKRLENTVTNLEGFLESIQLQSEANAETSIATTNIPTRINSPDDTFSDVDLDSFEIDKPAKYIQSVSVLSANDSRADAASLSDFHNVKDVLLNIRERLESYLKATDVANSSKNENSKNLEGNIEDLKRELERYVNIIEEKKQNELRRFSEGMCKQSNIIQMQKAFKRKESEHLYESIREKIQPRYAINPRRALSVPEPLSIDNKMFFQDGFTLRNCYDNEYIFDVDSDFSSVEYYTMLINDERSEKLLNDAPSCEKKHQNKQTSLIFQDHGSIIKQWQEFQSKRKKNKSIKLKTKNQRTHDDAWCFTLDYQRNRDLQTRLEKERKLRRICRTLFYLFSVICFVLVVLTVKSSFPVKDG